MSSMSQLTVLIVDDDESIARMLWRLYILEGFKVETARSGDEAAEKLWGRCPHLAIVDYNLPGKNGLEITQQLKGRCPKVHVFMVTGTEDPELPTKAAEVGAAFIPKPLSLPDLLTRSLSLFM